MTFGTPLPLSTVRAIIARSVLGGDAVFPERLGRVTLRPHQRAAAQRLVDLTNSCGGALLAEPVGVGKTYTSLAAAKRLGGELLVVAPASLREMWAAALDDCAMRAMFVSHESLSRGARVQSPAHVVIVDEAHRVRSPSTQRYAALADACRRSRVLLVSATPVQNRCDDLAAQLALFLGRRAWRMTDDELAKYVVRGSPLDDDATGGLPRQVGPHLLSLESDDDCLDELLALPAPVPARDESISAALLTYGLVHQWTSSRAALIAALRRRRTRGLALLAALEAGRRPTRAELSAWTHGGDAMQLAFPELVTTPAPSDDDVDVDGLVIAIDRHTAAIEAMLRRFRRVADPDGARAAALREVRREHPGERIIAFCHYAETVNALWTHLANDAGIAALTARGGRVAGGRISREAILAQFTARRSSAGDVPPSERIDLLIATDVLSEGLNLQEASVVVHLDLPWNPARLDQRVGRVRRLGSRHESVTVYCISPPASAERLLRIEERLREKLRVAQRTIGVAGRILPSPLASAGRGSAEQSGAVDAMLRSWAHIDAVFSATEPSLAAVAHATPGFLAAIHDGHTVRLIADLGDGIRDTPDTLARALTVANGNATEPRATLGDDAIERIERYLRAHSGSVSIDFGLAAAARSRRATLARVAQAVARTPRHRRAQIAALADAARAVATAPLGEGAERILETLANAELPDEAWLRSVATFGELHARPPHGADSAGRGVSRIIAVILFQPAAL